ncbi:guided entry of tail-anchored proteins factor 1-like [Gigantopelta aegis]|uniref:guided entry of tail-anchored proteins factor 1-like n=1 Tax=Gigantopelta aegis TaxID=1735272 RepID=UPI001B889B6C|nr:guided entry of tail-anchored proteins factor 1-like [Gigantopelta aegis]
MFLLLFILILVILFSILPHYLNDISLLIGKTLFKVSENELNLRAEVRDLKREQESVSVTEEFARHMKLKRKIDKLMADVKNYGKERSSGHTMLKVAIKVIIHILHVLIMLYLVVKYRADPLLYVPTSWVFPLHKVVAFPTAFPGGVGIACWIVACNTMVHRVKRIIEP